MDPWPIQSDDHAWHRGARPSPGTRCAGPTHSVPPARGSTTPSSSPSEAKARRFRSIRAKISGRIISMVSAVCGVIRAPLQLPQGMSVGQGLGIGDVQGRTADPPMQSIDQGIGVDQPREDAQNRGSRRCAWPPARSARSGAACPRSGRRPRSRRPGRAARPADRGCWIVRSASSTGSGGGARPWTLDVEHVQQVHDPAPDPAGAHHDGPHAMQRAP